MKPRTACLLTLALLAPIGVARPARAAGAYRWLELGRTASAVWQDKSTQSFAFVVVGEGVLTDHASGEPLIGDVGCVLVEDADRAAYGCGGLSHLTIDGRLKTASARGTFKAEVFDFKTEKTWKQGTISVSGTWKAPGLGRPRARGRYIIDGAFVHAAIEPGVGRDASDGVDAQVSADAIGQGRPQHVVEAQYRSVRTSASCSSVDRIGV
jgi:hypothetical protein